MSKKVTIAQVAKEAGVSIATVSRVLNQREGNIKISDETKAIVQAVADRLGYQADPFASALRTRHSGLFGAIIRDLRDPFLIKVFIEMQGVARENGIELLLGNANYDISVAGRQANIMSGLWFDGLILLGDMPGDLGIVHQLQQINKPCVAVACGTRHDVPSINLDEEAGVDLSMNYLYSLGHRRIACVGDPNLLGVRERLAAFKDYAENHDLILEDGYLVECPNDQRSAAHGAARLMSLPKPPTAIFCGTDLIGLGVINQLNRSGVKVPDDVSVTGFDDIEEAANAFPSLTTISQLADKLAQQALQLLLKIMDTPSREIAVETILVKPELIVRESCCPLKQPSATLEATGGR
ncbi:MAG: LacI family transcriptional regulator [Chloroflexi bacterium]|jgi:DNA-binding LacI/PurR family transcriptional regulator|nr:LacI family DNA-binding transcriptional regulator [Anaerolineaceae bacterium]NMB89487.1 LacI family transcriptional regulator [Chloroflexota bacterium]